jgi:4-amino-4-deoxy-L-arabinose transferase-like glycosyltransferase
MGAGVVVVAYRTAKIWWDERSARFAAISAMLAYPMFYFARTSNVDMGALLWTALGLAVFSSALRYGLTDRRALWLGVLAGLATATKDASYAPFAAMGAVLVVRHWPGRPGLSGHRSKWLQAPSIAIVAGGLTYAVASGLLFSLQRWLNHVEFVLHGSGVEGSYYFSTPPTVVGYLAVLADTARYVVQSLGWPVAIAAVIGVVLAARRERAALLLLLPILGIFLGVVAPVRFVLFRFVMFMAYTLTLFAGLCLGILWQRSRRWSPPLGRAMAVAAVVACLGWAAARGVDLTVQMARDSRYAVAEWLKRNAESGDVIGFYGAARKLPAIQGGVETVQLTSQPELPGTDIATIEPPDFVLVIPQQEKEPVHEGALSAADFQAFMDGSWGYELVLAVRGPTFTGERTVSFVNPPARVFARRDILSRLADQSPRIELSWP